MFPLLRSIASAHRLLLEIEYLLADAGIAEDEIKEGTEDLNGSLYTYVDIDRTDHFLRIELTLDPDMRKNEFTFWFGPANPDGDWHVEEMLAITTVNSGRSWRILLPKGRDPNSWTEPMRRFAAPFPGFFQERPKAYSRKQALQLIRQMAIIFAALPKK